MNNIKILALNLYGFRVSNDSKIHIFKEVCRKYYLDVVLLNETNTKWNSKNIDKIKEKLKQSGKVI